MARRARSGRVRRLAESIHVPRPRRRQAAVVDAQPHAFELRLRVLRRIAHVDHRQFDAIALARPRAARAQIERAIAEVTTRSGHRRATTGRSRFPSPRTAIFAGEGGVHRLRRRILRPRLFLPPAPAPATGEQQRRNSMRRRVIGACPFPRFRRPAAATGCRRPAGRARASDLLAKSATSSNCDLHRGEAHVADMVELAQLAITNSPTRRDSSSRSVVIRSWCTTARTAASIFSSDYRPLLQRAVRNAQLARIEILAAPVRLDDRRQLQFDGFQRGEPLAAGLALAAAADRRAILADPRIDDPGVGVLAERAMHLALIRRRPGTACTAGSRSRARRRSRCRRSGCRGRSPHVADPFGQRHAVRSL